MSIHENQYPMIWFNAIAPWFSRKGGNGSEAMAHGVRLAPATGRIHEPARQTCRNEYSMIRTNRFTFPQARAVRVARRSGMPNKGQCLNLLTITRYLHLPVQRCFNQEMSSD